MELLLGMLVVMALFVLSSLVVLRWPLPMLEGLVPSRSSLLFSRFLRLLLADLKLLKLVVLMLLSDSVSDSLVFAGCFLN